MRNISWPDAPKHLVHAWYRAYLKQVHAIRQINAKRARRHRLVSTLRMKSGQEYPIRRTKWYTALERTLQRFSDADQRLRPWAVISEDDGKGLPP